MGSSLRNLNRRSFLLGLSVCCGLRLANEGATAPSTTSSGAASGLDDFSSATEAASAIRAKKISSLELTRIQIARVEKDNPRINAIVVPLKEEALSQAREADKALDRGEWLGAFHGVPWTVKDSFEMKGVLTTAGEKRILEKSYRSSRDADAVARLRSAGAVFLGKTNVPRMSQDWQTYNDAFGTTNNPWDPTRTPGGSTGGGAAALAAGLGYLTLGSDRGGSIRIPAHFCGVYGHKPTAKLVSLRGHIPPLPAELAEIGSHSPPQPPRGSPVELAVAGPLARSAVDLQAAMAVLTAQRTAPALGRRWSLRPARASKLADYRMGYVLDDRLCPVTPEVYAVLHNVIVALRKAGVKLDDEGWPLGVVPATEFNSYNYMLDFALGFQRDRERLAAATKERQQARSVWQDYFRSHDAFLLPTAFVVAFPHDHSEPLWKRRIRTPHGMRPYSDLRFWVSFASLTGLPATTAPAGLSREGLPVGIQIIGPEMEDATTIDVAAKLADLIGGVQRPGGY